MLKVEMAEQEWIALMNMVALAPYRDAQPLIAKVSQQLMAQKELEGAPRPSSNGHDANVVSGNG